jgi:hypothetical protein
LRKVKKIDGSESLVGFFGESLVNEQAYTPKQSIASDPHEEA